MSQSDRRIRLTEIDQQIPQLRLQLERIQGIESLTFPILKLPVEVTTEISVRCLPPCMPSRGIATSTPKLWPSLAFPASEPNTELLAARDHLLECWLARSGQYPLSFRVLELPHCDQRQVGRPCLRLLLEHSAQWRRIEIRMKLPGIRRALEAVKPPILLDFPRLEHLRIGAGATRARTWANFVFWGLHYNCGAST
ncbi:hypothetical protein C8F04DRAFT_1404094 [Mycena alexandri]|uniref:Uncharacterized protein n=1 Tax=Mycena alexandri TaxID=1745969 RepID=A0AAD6S2H7_9AGAR|nr:hypothetical protein C8F04DRAFT_1404094 [Mycena alexandri]